MHVLLMLVFFPYIFKLLHLFQGTWPVLHQHIVVFFLYSDDNTSWILISSSPSQLKELELCHWHFVTHDQWTDQPHNWHSILLPINWLLDLSCCCFFPSPLILQIQHLAHVPHEICSVLVKLLLAGVWVLTSHPPVDSPASMSLWWHFTHTPGIKRRTLRLGFIAVQALFGGRGRMSCVEDLWGLARTSDHSGVGHLWISVVKIFRVELLIATTLNTLGWSQAMLVHHSQNTPFTLTTRGNSVSNPTYTCIFFLFWIVGRNCRKPVAESELEEVTPTSPLRYVLTRRGEFSSRNTHKSADLAAEE